MTEKLTYDPTPADAPEFTEDEQDSLAVAEKLGQEESELYAGKYQSAEELEEAYINLHKKLGTYDEDDVETEFLPLRCNWITSHLLPKFNENTFQIRSRQNILNQTKILVLL